MESQLAQAAAPASWDSLPYELKFAIMDGAHPDTLRSIARCSRSCFQAVFAFRSPRLTVILNGDTVKLFQKGAIFEASRYDVRSIHIRSKSMDRPGSLSDWLHGWYNGRKVRPFATADADHPGNTISMLRVATKSLCFFPALESLCIYYDLPGSSASNNTYLAVIKSIPRTCYENLKHLDFQIFQFPSSVLSGANPSYEDLRSQMPPENRDFLGISEIPDDKIEELVKGALPPMPNLKSFKMASNFIPSPGVDTATDYYQRSKFYYLPITPQISPGLTDLQIETIDDIDLYNPPDEPFGQLWFTEEDKPATESSTQSFLDNPRGFESITHLSLEANRLSNSQGLHRLQSSFPNLQKLSIKAFGGRTYDNGGELYETISLEDYGLVKNWKSLKQLDLPWPRTQNGCTPAEDLSELCRSWRETTLPELEQVLFKGFRRQKYGVWASVVILVKLWENNSGGVELSSRGCNFAAAYEDYRNTGEESESESEDETEGRGWGDFMY
ncbi:hypothetical protein TWF481_011012 [Arthrobotrys musiformis]|uniref:F-box domain-containing protein n=1 Tax=Arthrobotrys musiformis TaxID=47236 RepID=A0AAV9VX11_9PEZI